MPDAADDLIPAAESLDLLAGGGADDCFEPTADDQIPTLHGVADDANRLGTDDDDYSELDADDDNPDDDYCMVLFGLRSNLFEIDGLLSLDDDMVNDIEYAYYCCVYNSPGGLSSGAECTGILNPSVTAIFPATPVLKRNAAQFFVFGWRVAIFPASTKGIRGNAAGFSIPAIWKGCDVRGWYDTILYDALHEILAADRMTCDQRAMSICFGGKGTPRRSPSGYLATPTGLKGYSCGFPSGLSKYTHHGKGTPRVSHSGHLATPIGLKGCSCDSPSGLSQYMMRMSDWTESVMETLWKHIMEMCDRLSWHTNKMKNHI